MHRGNVQGSLNKGVSIHKHKSKFTSYLNSIHTNKMTSSKFQHNDLIVETNLLVQNRFEI